MNWLDYLILLLILLSTALGTARGFIRAVFGFVSTLLGVFLGARSYDDIAKSFYDHLSNPGVANFIGFMIVFITVLIIGGIFGHLVSRTVDWAGLRWLDHVLGGGLGMVRGGLVGAALVMAMCAFSRTPPPRSVVESRMSPIVIDGAYLAAKMTPAKVHDDFQIAYGMVMDRWRPKKADPAAAAAAKKGGSKSPAAASAGKARSDAQ